jgi:gluconokinase
MVLLGRRGTDERGRGTVGRIVVVMGVSGVGKSTVGRLVASALGVPFVDADDFHDAESIALMHAGHPLDTAHRVPWLDRVNAALRAEVPAGAVVACSALTADYRARLVAGLRDVVFVLLTGPLEVLRTRLEARIGHFAGPALLSSQLATLEAPPDAIVEDVHDAPKVVAARVVATLSDR